jgi:hypothetical protein
VGWLDGAGAVVWLWLLGNVATDLDGRLVDSLGGWASFLSDFRLVIFLIALALLVLLVKGWKLAAGFAYVAAFPLIFGLWKLPILLFRGRSPVFLVGFAHVATAVVGGARRTIVALALAVVAVLAVVATPWAPAISLGALILGGLVLWLVGRAAMASIKPSGFITSQQRKISDVVDGDVVGRIRSHQNLATTPDQVVAWDREQATSYVTSAATGVIMYRGLFYYADTLDKYRRSPLSMVFSCLRVVAVVVLTGVGMGLVYLAIFRLSPAEFAFEREPSLLTFIYFAFSSATFGEIEALTPVGDVTIAVKLVNGVLNSVILLTLAAALLLSYRASKSDQEAEAAIGELRKGAAAMSDEVGSTYAASTTDLETRLVDYQFAFKGVLLWLIKRTPSPEQ